MNKALLIIGLHTTYFDKNDSIKNNKPNYALQSISRILEHFRDKKLPVFHIKNPDTEYDDLFIETIPELLPLENEVVIERKEINCFYETDLHRKLQELEINELVICGMLTDLVIDTAVRFAKDLAYDVTLISDACVSRDLEFNGIKFPSILVTNVFLAALQNDYAQILSSKEYISIQNEDMNSHPIEKINDNLLDEDFDDELLTIENQDAITAEDLKDLESVDEEYLIYEYDK